MSEALQIAKALAGAEDTAVKDEVVRNVVAKVVPDIGNTLLLWMPLGTATAQRPRVFLNEAGREMSDVIDASHVLIRRVVLRAAELERAIEDVRELLNRCLRRFNGDESKCKDLSERYNALVSEYAELDGEVRRELGISVALTEDKASLMALIDEGTRVAIKDRLLMLIIAASEIPYQVLGAQPAPATPTQPPPQPQQPQQQSLGKTLMSVFLGTPRRGGQQQG